MITKDTKKVLVVMDRYNPQLGNYCTIRKGEVKKVLKNTVTVDCGALGEKKFDLQGMEKKPSQSLYGSAYYYICTYEDAVTKYDRENNKFNMTRISTGKNIVEEVVNC